MYVWEMVSCRLQTDGWELRHTSTSDVCGPNYIVHLKRSGLSFDVSGPTLTEAYAAAAKRARESLGSRFISRGIQLSRFNALAQA